MSRLLEILTRERMQTAVEETWYNSNQYREGEKQYDEMYSKVMKGMVKEQWGQLDRLMSLYNQFNVEYGEVAYRQGLVDGFRLARELGGV